MKTKKRIILLRAFNYLVALSLLIITLFAFSKPMFLEHSSNKNKPQIYRPILDSTIVCSYYETRSGDYEMSFFYTVEHMPRPLISTDMIENILRKEIRLNTKELLYHDTIGFQCVINCHGKAGDFQILKCNTPQY